MERPIIFSGPMVRAILEGRKTQTRRVAKALAGINPDLTLRLDQEHIVEISIDGDAWYPTAQHVTCPYGKPGDRLWVRESYCYGDSAPSDAETNRKVLIYRGDGDAHPEAWERRNGGAGVEARNLHAALGFPHHSRNNPYQSWAVAGTTSPRCATRGDRVSAL